MEEPKKKYREKVKKQESGDHKIRVEQLKKNKEQKQAKKRAEIAASTNLARKIFDTHKLKEKDRIETEDRIEEMDVVICRLDNDLKEEKTKNYPLTNEVQKLKARIAGMERAKDQC